MNDLIIMMMLVKGPAYGYALKRNAGLIFGGAMHNNVIYPSLKRFMRNGWVEQSTVPGERGQQRKQYRLTAAGKKHFYTRIQSFGEQEAADERAFLLRVAFFDALSTETRERIIAARTVFLKGRAAEFSQLRKITSPESSSLLALDRVQSQVRDELRWIRRIAGRRSI